MAAWIKMPLGMEVDPGDSVLDGDPAPLPKKGGGAAPQFSAHVRCGKTAGWIKIPLGTKVGLGPGHMLDGDTAPPAKKGATPSFPSNFRPMSVAAKRLDGSRCRLVRIKIGLGLGQGDIVFDENQAPLKKAQPPTFRPMSTSCDQIAE